MNDKIPVQITVKGVQTIEGESDTTTLVTEGFIAHKGNAVYLTYNESEATGFAGHSTTLKIEKDKISLTRYGAFRTKLVIQPGESHVCDYPTPYGMLQLIVVGKEISGHIEKKGDKLMAEYDLMQGEDCEPINNKLFISVK